jgi:hypothetical protein
MTKVDKEWSVREIVSRTTLTLSILQSQLSNANGSELLYFRDYEGKTWSTTPTQLANLLEPKPWLTLPNGSRNPGPTLQALSFRERCEKSAYEHPGPNNSDESLQEEMELDLLPRVSHSELIC